MQITGHPPVCSGESRGVRGVRRRASAPAILMDKDLVTMDNKEKNPIEIIQELYPNLSKSQKKISDVLLHKRDIAVFLSIQELCALADVTPATVLRFSRTLGFSGYAELKKSLQAHHHNKMYPLQFRDGMMSAGGGSPDLRAKLDRLMEEEMNLLAGTYQELDFDTLMEAAALLCRAKKIYLAGFGLVLWPVKILEHRLAALQRDSTVLTFENYSLLPSILERATADDVFVLFTFPNYLSTVKGIAQCAQAKGCRIICITDRASAPAAAYAEKLLLCRAENGVHSLSVTAAASLVNVITAAMSAQLDESALHHENMAAMMAEYGTPVSYWQEGTGFR